MAEVLDIYFAKVNYRGCRDPRPCIVVYLKSGKIAGLACGSAATSLRDLRRDFVIAPGNPDFAATGLSRETHVSPDVVELEESLLTKRIGRLENQLARDFKKWFGM